MKPRPPPEHALSQLDAFFVAYQERTGVLMQHGVELQVKGELQREQLYQVLTHIVDRWPSLGQTLSKSWTGLRWRGERRVEDMLKIGHDSDAVPRWRNQPLGPFPGAPFSVALFARQGSQHAGFSLSSCRGRRGSFHDYLHSGDARAGLNHRRERHFATA